MFTGTMSRGAYARAALICIGLFLILELAIAFVLFAVSKKGSCQTEGCMTFVAVMVTFFAEPILYLFFLLSRASISVRRLRDAGYPVALAAAIPLLMLLNLSFGITWSAQLASLFFGEGAQLWLPKFFLAALCAIGGLCIAPSAQANAATSRPEFR